MRRAGGARKAKPAVPRRVRLGVAVGSLIRRLCGAAPGNAPTPGLRVLHVVLTVDGPRLRRLPPGGKQG
jgi:hypothetical protein